MKPSELPDDAPIFFEISPGRSGKLRRARFLPLRFARPHRYEVVGVRCERVNETDEDSARWNLGHPDPGTRFDDAPFVFVYEFKKVL